MARARALVAQSELANREVHVFTDMQASAFAEPPTATGDVPVVVFGVPARDRGNRGIADVTFGDGLAPLAGRRTEAAVSIAGGAAGAIRWASGSMSGDGCAPRPTPPWGPPCGFRPVRFRPASWRGTPRWTRIR